MTRAKVCWAAIGAACLVTALLAADPSASESGGRAIDADDSERIDAFVERELPALLETYRELHANPELSLEEAKTAARVARFLRRGGYATEKDVGGHGVIGVLRNGEGPTLLIRGDMDGLPVTEATGLHYASKLESTNAEGAVVGVMHACGHDVHVTNLLGTAALLAEMRDAWRGTVVILAQPAEEVGLGALHMIEDGLFEKIPLPDHGIALHVGAELRAGTIGYVSGWAAANVDWVKITVHGRGGHGARPHQAVDPIVASAHLITALQTIVSRRVDPSESAVVTVGSIHGGAKSNVIPDEVKLELTVRSYSDDVRALLLDSIVEIAGKTCEAFDCPAPPEIWIKPDSTPAMYNDPELTAHAVRIFEDFLGDDSVEAIPATMTGEDFSRYTRRGGFPTFLYRLGSVGSEKWRASREGGEPLPSLHSSQYAPDAQRTLETGVRSMARLALSLLGEPSQENR
jgi:amidohydrolase